MISRVSKGITSSMPVDVVGVDVMVEMMMETMMMIGMACIHEKEKEVEDQEVKLN